MLSIYDEGPCPPCPLKFNLAGHVLGRADELPDKTALNLIYPESNETWSYSQLKKAVLGTSAGLLKSGLLPGDRIVMRIGNTIEFPIAYLGAIAVGIVPIPTSPQLTESEVNRIISSSTPKAILHDLGVSCPQTSLNVIQLDALKSMRDLPPAKIAMGNPNRLAYVIYTSGTSGTPRAVMHAHRAIWARQMMFEGWYGMTETDRLLHAGAFNWTYTLGTGLMDPWTIGATALIPGPGVDTSQLSRLMKRHKATIFAAAPGVFRKILNIECAFDVPELRHGLSAGEKLPETIRKKWERATGKPIFEAYGMSECSTFVSGSPDMPAPCGTLGRPQKGRRIAIVDAHGPVPLGNEGTIAIHRDDPGLMLGYHNAPDETSSRYIGDWFATGDQGAMDSDGSITYLGRADDMMNAGGYRVSPIEVENVLNAHPGISDSAVTDIEVKPDVRLVMAFYTGRDALPEHELAEYASSRLAGYKCPRGYFHVDTLPTGANGKILRRQLRPIYGMLKSET